jgi:hypothetical protein
MRPSSTRLGSVLGHVHCCGLAHRGKDGLGRAPRLGSGRRVGNRAVDVSGECVTRMTQQVLHGVQAGRAVQRIHRGPVPEVVQPDWWQPVLPHEGCEPVSQPAWPDRSPVGPREHEAGLIGGCCVIVEHALLTPPVIGEDHDGCGIEGDRPVTGGGLGSYLFVFSTSSSNMACTCARVNAPSR